MQGAWRPIAALLLLVAVGCTTDDGDPQPERLPATWELGADFCTALGLVATLEAHGHPNPEERGDDVEPGEARCLASAVDHSRGGPSTDVTVTVFTTTDTGEWRRRWESGRNQSKFGESMVPHGATEVPGPEPATWAQEREGARYSLFLPGPRGGLDATRAAHGVVLGDDNLVAVVQVMHTEYVEQSDEGDADPEVLERADDLAEAVLAAIPESAMRPDPE